MADSDKNIRITTSKNKTTFPNIVFTGSSAGSSVITLEVLDDNTVSFTSNEGQIFSLDSNMSVGTIWSVSDISGTPLLRASAGATVGISELSGGLGVGTTNPSIGTYKFTVRGQSAFASTNDNANQFVAAQCPVLQNETISCLSSIPNVAFRLAISIAEEIAATPGSKK